MEILKADWLEKWEFVAELANAGDESIKIYCQEFDLGETIDYYYAIIRWKGNKASLVMTLKDGLAYTPDEGSWGMSVELRCDRNA